MAAVQTRRILIQVDTKGAPQLEDISKSLGKVTNNTKKLADSMDFLKNAATSYLGVLGIRELVSFSDEIQNLNNKLLAMSGSQSEAAKTMTDLVTVARETNQSLDAVSNGYFRMSLALKDANISQASLIELTKVISNTFRLSGASTEEATNATIQLGQAFSLGVLRGQDLRSVMSQNVVLTRLLRREFGTNLLKEAEKGMITVPRLMGVLFKNMQDVNSQAKVMSATFDQSLTKAIDAVKLKVYELSSAMNASSVFATGVAWMIKNIGTLTTLAAILAVTTLPILTSSLWSMVAALAAVNIGMTALVATLGVGLVAAVALFGDSFDISDLVIQFKVGVSVLKGLLDDLVAYYYEVRADFSLDDSVAEGFKKLAKAARDSSKDHYTHAAAIRVEADAQQALAEQTKKEMDAAKRRAEDLARANNFFTEDLSVKQMLAALNKQYLAGRLSVSEYNKAILDFDMRAANKQFRDGEKDLAKLNDQLRKVQVFRVNREFKDGALDVEQYKEAINTIKVANLREDLEAGTISLNEFNTKLADVQNNFSAGGAWRAGLTEYLTSIGSTTQQVAGLIKNAFSQLETVFVDFIKTGKFEFAKFTEAILDD